MVNWLSCLEFLLLFCAMKLCSLREGKVNSCFPNFTLFSMPIVNKNWRNNLHIYYSTAQPSFPIAVFRHKIMKISIVIIVVYYTCYKSSMNPRLWCLTLRAVNYFIPFVKRLSTNQFP